MRRHGWMAAAAAAALACANGANYPSPWGPRYAGGLAPAAAVTRPSAVLRLVTFNTRYASQIDSAIALLEETPALERPDVVALQEIDAASTARVARALGLEYVYYPATMHPKFHRDFGNAVLSRWPIVADRKLPLPHLGRFRQTERVVTAATISVDGTPVRVYSAHLGTLSEIGPGSKRDQVDAILADAVPHERVIILGDMNSHGIGKAFREAGYDWPTEHNPNTIKIWNWDHIFLKGMTLADARATGVVADNRDASDHRVVWAVVASPIPAK